MITLWLLALIGLLGSALLLLVASFRFAFQRYRSLLGPAEKSERYFVWAALVAALLGSLGLFVLPVYTGSSCSVSLSVTASPSSPASVSVPVSSCPEHRATFMQVNGPQVIPIFIAPILFAVVPLALLKLRFRSFLFAVFAFLLAGQAAVGMSGYGLAFAPSSVLLVLAGFFGLTGRSAQHGAPADRSTAAQSA